MYSSSTISNAEVEGWYFTYDSSTGKYKTSTDVYAWDEEAVATIAFNSSASTTISVNLEIWGDVDQSSIQYTELDNCMSIAGSLNPGGTVQGGMFSKTISYSVSAGYHFFQIKYHTGMGKGETYAMFKLPFTATNTLFEGDSCPTVSFSSDGNVVMEKPVPVGGTYGIFPVASKSGYLFDGWYTSSTGGTKVSSTTRITSNSSHTLYAQFSDSGYVISLTGDIGIASLSGNGMYSGGTAVTIKATVKAGYTFAGWDDGDMNLSRNITVTASKSYRATTVANTYTVTFDPNAGLTPYDGEVTDFVVKNVGKDAFHKVTEFDYWCDDFVGDVRAKISFNASSQMNLKIYLDYEIRALTGASPINIYVSDLDASDEDEYKSELHVDKSGVTTVKFSTFSAGQHSIFIWFERRTAKIYPSELDADVGFVFEFLSVTSDETTKQVTFNEMYGTLPVPTKLNHTFAGWWTTKTGGTQVISTTVYKTAGNRILYAHWTPTQREITVKLMVIDKNGNSATELDTGGSVDVTYTNYSTNSVVTEKQTIASAVYTVYAGEDFTLVACKNPEYIFSGFSTSPLLTDSLKYPSATVSMTATFQPSSSITYYIYFKQVSENKLKYDEIEKYFYFEDGFYPQSEVAVETSIIGTDIFEDCSSLNSDSSYSVDSNRHIFTLNMHGAYEAVEKFALLDGGCDFVVGDIYGLNIRFVSGNVENPNGSIFQLNLNGWSDEYYAPIGNNYVNAPLNLSSSSELIVGSDKGDASFLTLIIDCKGGLVFDNAVYEIEVVKVDNLMIANGESFTYCDGSGDVTIPVYTNGVSKFVKMEKNGTSAWFKFEPIRWRISDYGVEKTEENIARYTTLLKFNDYASFSDNFVAVSDLILGVGAMHSTRTVQEGDSIEDMAGFQNIQNMTNSLSNDTLKTVYSRTGNVINVDSYSGYERGQANAVNKENTLVYSSAFRICSVAELDEVGFVNKGAKASDMVAFILGMDKDQVSYWTRDLSNLGAGVAITPTGTQIRPWLDEVLGMRFAYTFREGSNVAF